jgi:hypothetical protein
MRARIFVSFAAVVLAATSLEAQTGIDKQRCPDGTANAFGVPDQAMASQDACQKAIDLFQYLAPQLGVSITGGNATLGQTGNLGGFGHFAVGIRTNIVKGSLPQIQDVTPGVTGARSDNYATKDEYLPMPTADLAVGIFKGIPLALTNVGGIDALVSASFLPGIHRDGIDVMEPNGSLKVGYGARIGILQESLLIPGVSVSYLVRDLPTVSATATSGNDSLYVKDLSVKTKAWRVVAGKNLFLFGVAAGFGQDKYDASTETSVHVAARTVPPIPATNTTGVSLTQSLTRTNMFADVSINLLLFKITAEVGQVSGGTVHTYNTFSGNQADDSRLYGSIGGRVGF